MAAKDLPKNLPKFDDIKHLFPSKTKYDEENPKMKIGVESKHQNIQAKCETKPTVASTVTKKAKPSMYRVDTSKQHPSLVTTKPDANIFWGQTEKLLLIHILIELPHNKIDITYDAKSFHMKFPELDYNLSLLLANPIDEKFMIYKVNPNNVEIKLKKDLYRTSKSNMTWKALCKDAGHLEKGRVDDQLEKEDSSKMDTTEETPTSSSTSNGAPAKVSHDWYQTDTEIIVEVRVKGLLENEVQVEFERRRLSLTAKLPYSKNREYQATLDLAHEVVPEKSSYKVLSTKLEIKMPKKEWSLRWLTLEIPEEPKETEQVADEPNDNAQTSDKPKQVDKKKDNYKYWDSKESQNFMDTEIWKSYRESVDKKNDMRSRDKFVQDSIQDYIAMHNSCPPGVNPRDIWGGNIPPRYY